MFKEVQHKYLNKKPSEISKMNVRDITMALQQLNDYCLKKIKKADKNNEEERNKNLIKQATVAEKASQYIFALIILWKTKKLDTKWEDLKLIKTKSSLYDNYVKNFEQAYKNANNAIQGQLPTSPQTLWDKLMNIVEV